MFINTDEIQEMALVDETRNSYYYCTVCNGCFFIVGRGK